MEADRGDDGREHVDSNMLEMASMLDRDRLLAASGLPAQESNTLASSGLEELDEEETDSPALFLRRFWCKVSIEPVTFDCYRSPKSMSSFTPCSPSTAPLTVPGQPAPTLVR